MTREPATGYTVRAMPYSAANEGKPWLAMKDKPGVWTPQWFATREEAVDWTHEARFHERSVTGT